MNAHKEIDDIYMTLNDVSYRLDAHKREVEGIVTLLQKRQRDIEESGARLNVLGKRLETVTTMIDAVKLKFEPLRD